MRAGCEPFAADQRFGGERGAADDVGSGDGRAEVGDRTCRVAVGGERGGQACGGGAGRVGSLLAPTISWRRASARARRDAASADAAAVRRAVSSPPSMAASGAPVAALNSW